MSSVNPTTEDIERLQKQLSKALGNEYQVEMDTAVSSPYFNIKNHYCPIKKGNSIFEIVEL